MNYRSTSPAGGGLNRTGITLRAHFVREVRVSELYIVAAQPNPPGRDSSYGRTTNDRLNEEWLEFRALQDRNLIGDVLTNLTFNERCQRTGVQELLRFTDHLKSGQHVRVHTGRGTPGWVGNTYHMYLNREWFVWNNACGDRATLAYEARVIDSAFYRALVPEGQLVRVQGTDELVPVGRQSLLR